MAGMKVQEENASGPGAPTTSELPEPLARFDSLLRDWTEREVWLRRVEQTSRRHGNGVRAEMAGAKADMLHECKTALKQAIAPREHRTRQPKS